MLWFLIIPALWTWLFHTAWTATEKWPYGEITWPESMIGWAGMLSGMLLCSLVGGLIAAGIATALGAWADNAKIWHLEDRSTEKLVSIRDKDGVKGEIAGGIFLMAGHIESQPYYFYYTQDSSGAIRPDKISATRSVYIHETEDGSEPKLVERQWDNGRKWLDLFAFTSGGWQFHFYVPKGTVRRDMTM